MSIFNELLNQLVDPKKDSDPDLCDLVVLEQRVLYSAAPIPVDAVEVVEDFDADAEECHFSAGEDIENCFGEIFEAMDSLALDEDGIVSSSELIVVDTSLEGYETLVNDILLASDSSRNFEIVYIDENEDGIEKLTGIFANRQGLDAVHLVTHGADGELELGSSTLDIETLNESESVISQWRFALDRDADFLIYGCNVAETESGEDFVQRFSDIVETDVAASADLTGHAELGGDWDFEFQVGQIEATAAFSIDAQADWLGTLEANGDSQDGTASSLGVSENGEFVVALTAGELDDLPVSAGEDREGQDVFYNVFRQGSDAPVEYFRINDTVAGDQNQVSVAVAANGNSVFVWTSDHTGSDGVYAKIIGADGSVILAETALEEGGASNAHVSADTAGNFVVTWQATNSLDSDQGVFAQAFDSTGNAVGDLQTVNTTLAGLQGNADVSLNNEGEFVIVWDDYVDIDTESSVYFRQFNVDFQSDLVSGGAEQNLSGDFSGNIYRNAAVDLTDDGFFGVAYTTDSTTAVGPLGALFDTGVEGQLWDFDSGFLNFLRSGPLELPFVNESFNGPQENPDIVVIEAPAPNGSIDRRVVVSWEGQSDDGLSLIHI